MCKKGKDVSKCVLEISSFSMLPSILCILKRLFSFYCQRISLCWFQYSIAFEEQDSWCWSFQKQFYVPFTFRWRFVVHSISTPTFTLYPFSSFLSYVFWSLEEVGIEKKIIASVSPNNSDVQYKVMLEHRVLRRLCVQKIVVDTPIKNKLDKVMLNS